MCFGAQRSHPTFDVPHLPMLHTILGLLGAALAWLAWEFLGDIVGEVSSLATGPIRRPIWRMFVTAAWPWPLLLMMFLGAGAAAFGLLQLRNDVSSWRKTVALIAVLGGFAFVLLAPFIWRDARRERAANYRN
jgi:hypothetical protein